MYISIKPAAESTRKFGAVMTALKSTELNMTEIGKQQFRQLVTTP